MMVGGHSGRTRANAKGGVNGRAPVCIRASNERKQTVGKVDNASSVSTQSVKRPEVPESSPQSRGLPIIATRPS